MEKKEIFVWLKFAAILFLVVALGLLAVNQALGYYYKAHFLKSPCDLCTELNPDVRECIYPKLASYPDGLGGWIDPKNKTNYNLTLAP